MTIVPVYHVLLVPDTTMYLRTDVFESMSGRTPVPEEKVTLLVAKEAKHRDELESDSFYPIGLSAIIGEVHHEGYLVLKTQERVNIDEVSVSASHNIDLVVSRRGEVEDLDSDELARRLEAVKQSMRDFTVNLQWGEAARVCGGGQQRKQ